MIFYQRALYLLVTLAVLAASPVFAGEAGVMARENGVLENTQVALLLLSGLVFLVQSFRVERNVRVILWMGAWLSPSIILRELDIEKLAVPQWVIAIGSGTGRNLIMGIGWIALCVIVMQTYSEWKGSFGRIARSRTATFMLAAGVTLLLGALFDHGFASVEKGKLWEELFETIGYSLLLLASFFLKSSFSVRPEDISATGPEPEEA